MRVLYDTVTDCAALVEEAELSGASDVVAIDEDVLDAEQARRLIDCLSLPPTDGSRAVVATYRSALPRAFDLLLGPVEDMRDDVSLLVACPGPYPETFASRFQAASMPRLDQASLFDAFASLDRDNSIDELVAQHPHLPAAGIRHLYDQYMQGVGLLVEFVSSVHDGAREAGLRVCTGFQELHAGMLACELDMQLQSRSIARTHLTRVPHQRLLLAASYSDVRHRMSPSVYAALVWHALVV